MKILLTGFEPFGGSKYNASEQLIAELVASEFPQYQVSTGILPVDSMVIEERLVHLLETEQPDAVICLGEAGNRTSISLERIAINLADFRIADNGGRRLLDEPISPEGPAAYFSTLPLRMIEKRISDELIPVEISYSAGTYLCNYVFYFLMDRLARETRRVMGGFIHVPILPAAAVGTKSAPSMNVSDTSRALKLCMDCVLESFQPVN